MSSVTYAFHLQELIKQLSDLNSSALHENSEEHTKKSHKKKRLSTIDVPVMSKKEISTFHQELLQHGSVQLMVLNNFSSHFSPPALPKPLSDLYNPCLLNKPYEEILLECVRLEQKGVFRITKAQSEAVEKVTLQQFKSPIWNRYRSGLCTASNSHQICHTSMENPSISLLKKIRYPAGSTFSTEATRYVYSLNLKFSTLTNNY
jgi:hypothetical protein